MFAFNVGDKMIEEKVKKIIRDNNLIEDGDRLVLGVSGGPDSITMLDILWDIMNSKEISFSIVVAHINHGLRDNAKLDEEYVVDYCKKHDLKGYVLHADIKEEARKLKRGLEDTGRIIRYKYYTEIMEKTNSNKIAIAHNMNDRVETIIMNLMRGTGLEGLRGIDQKNGKYIRPLLTCSREEIEDYCDRKKLNPRHDESNDENDYTRNKIRNIVIPYIKKEFNPNVEESIIRLSDITKEDLEWISKEVQDKYEKIVISKKDKEIILNRKIFNSYDIAIQKRIVLKSIEELFGTTQGIEKIHVDDVVKLCNNNIGNKYLTPNKNTKIELINKQIVVTKLN